MKNTYIAGIVAALLLLAAVVFGGGLTQGQVAGTTTGPIKIGVVYAQTGPAASWTDYGRKALEMAAAEINAEGGVHGRTIELVVEDSKTNPADSVSAFLKLTEVDDVDAVIGDMWSFITNPLIPVADQKGVLLVSPTVMDASVEGSSEHFYTVGHTVSGEANAVRTFFETNAGITTASILCWNDNWGKAHSKLFREIAAENGVQVVAEECTSDFGTDYRTEMTKVKSLKADALFLTAAYPDVALKAYAELGMTEKVLTLYITDAVEIRDMPRSHAQNAWFIDWMPNDEFTKKFQETYGVYPILEAQNHYDALYAVAYALRENGENPSEGITKVSFQGAGGVIDFKKGDHIRANTAEAKLYRVHPVEGYTEVK